VSTVVCVLGMHRSGTSLVARILNLLGVEMGPEASLLHPGPDNPLGFWEHVAFVAVNKEILSRYGGSWDEPPALEAGWEASAELSDLRATALELVDHEFPRSELWGWKDPRNCLTLPFWQRLVPGMRYVICLRNPLDVARSLERRDGFSPEKAGDLWVSFVEASFRNTAGQDRLILFYEDVMADWPRELARLSKFIGQPDAAGFEHLRTSVWTAVHEELYHHRSSTAEVLDDPRLPASAKVLHVVLRGHVAQAEGLPGAREESREALGRFSSSREDRRTVRRALSVVEESGGLRELQTALRHEP
jgi:hypothetical protein